jgi:hypothetical protein
MSHTIVPLVLVLAITMAPMLAHASGCLAHHTMIGPIQPDEPPPPQVLPTKGTPYALYWLFHT